MLGRALGPNLAKRLRVEIRVYSTISFHKQFHLTIFSVSLKFLACYITGQWEEFTVNNTTSFLHMLSWHFLFFVKKFVFIIFVYFFDEVSNFRNRILTNQKPIRNALMNTVLVRLSLDSSPKLAVGRPRGR